jgi:hypothetical protein
MIFTDEESMGALDSFSLMKRALAIYSPDRSFWLLLTVQK